MTLQDPFQLCFLSIYNSELLSLRTYKILRYYYEIRFYKIYVMLHLHLFALQTSIVISVANFPETEGKYIAQN